MLQIILSHFIFIKFLRKKMNNSNMNYSTSGKTQRNSTHRKAPNSHCMHTIKRKNEADPKQLENEWMSRTNGSKHAEEQS